LDLLVSLVVLVNMEVLDVVRHMIGRT
jgi:hypothetical protein